ncbi:MAG: Imm70 family immunity protein [Pseudomonadota bacterium]
MNVGLSFFWPTGSADVYRVGSSKYLEAFFGFVEHVLESGDLGSRFPVLMKSLYLDEEHGVEGSEAYASLLCEIAEAEKLMGEATLWSSVAVKHIPHALLNERPPNGAKNVAEYFGPIFKAIRSAKEGFDYFEGKGRLVIVITDITDRGVRSMYPHLGRKAK